MHAINDRMRIAGWTRASFSPQLNARTFYFKPPEGRGCWLRLRMSSGSL
jgi:hypothetical protein